MPSINERTVLVVILVIISVATLFCLIGIAVPGWNGYSLFSWSKVASVALCIISLLLLVACVVLAVLIVFGTIQHAQLPFVFVILLIISSIFLLGAFTSFTYSTYNHSYNLIVTSFAFTYLSSILATYWCFGARGTSGNAIAPAR